MTLEDRIEALVQLGNYIRQKDTALLETIEQAYIHNKWFTTDNIHQALDAIADRMLEAELLRNWVKKYEFKTAAPSKKVGIVTAGNIPMVGFHDLLCVFVSGCTAMIKFSEKDAILIPFLIQQLVKIDERAASRFEVLEKLAGFDAVIATGSNNSARYFESYFGKYPSIIRKNRNAVAVLNGNENEAALKALGKDIFQYFGLGCRNVSKLYVPEGYDFDPLLEALHTHKEIILHNKYKNNFDYNYTLVILNKTPYKANGCIILTEEETIASRIASLHFEYYNDREALIEKLQAKQNDIQCVVTGEFMEGLQTIPFGKAQQPALNDYADGVDVMAFLLGLE